METLQSISPEIQARMLTDATKKYERELSKAIRDGDVATLHSGTAITLPAEPSPMEIPKAIEILDRRFKEDEAIVDVAEHIKGLVWDTLVQFERALRITFGWVGGKDLPSFFGPMKPTMRSIEVGYNSHVQVPFGGFFIPGFGDKCHLETNFGSPTDFYITGKVKRKNLPQVKVLADITRSLLRTHSIYKGKAWGMQVDDNGNMEMGNPPSFLNMDTAAAQTMFLTFSKTLSSAVEANLWAPLEHTQICRDANIPLKRGVLLEGPYGTGKTLISLATAKKAVENGWTFIMLNDVRCLNQALAFARAYSPAVVFAEDIDRVTSGQERSVDIDHILNTIDGLNSKDAEVVTVLTTNHVENINRAMLRPGRLDAVISVTPPDAEAAERLIRHYAGTRLDPYSDLTEAAKGLEGQVPASIREAVERAKLYAIAKGNPVWSITGSDVLQSASMMQAHLQLLNEKKDTPTEAEKFFESFSSVVRNAFGAPNAEVVAAGLDKSVYSTIKDTAENVEIIRDHVA